MDAQKQAKIRTVGAWLALPVVASSLLSIGCPSTDETPAYDPPLLEPHVVNVVADAFGDPKTPARVALFLQRGALHVAGGAKHLVQGVATGATGDPPPRVDVGADRVSVVQAPVGGAPPTGDATFELALGRVPTALSVDTGSGESQSIDLGGLSIASANVHTATGHVTLDWTKPNAIAGGRLELATEAGTIEVTHLGRFGGKAVAVKEADGLVVLDLGDRIDQPLTIDAEVGAGKFTLRVPMGVAARAHVTSSASGGVTASGWRSDGEGFVLGDASLAPRVVIRVRCVSGRVELVAT